MNSSTRLPHDRGASMEAPAGRGASAAGFGASAVASDVASGPGVGGLASGRERSGVVTKLRLHWQRRHSTGRLGAANKANAALLLGTAIGRGDGGVSRGLGGWVECCGCCDGGRARFRCWRYQQMSSQISTGDQFPHAQWRCASGPAARVGILHMVLIQVTKHSESSGPICPRYSAIRGDRAVHHDTMPHKAEML